MSLPKVGMQAKNFTKENKIYQSLQHNYGDPSHPLKEGSKPKASKYYNNSSSTTLALSASTWRPENKRERVEQKAEYIDNRQAHSHGTQLMLMQLSDNNLVI